MNRLSSLAVTLIGFGFTAMGLFLLFSAETDDDLLMAGVTTLFFAAVGLVGLMDLLPASVPRQQPGGRIVVGASRLRAGIFALGGLAFLVAGIVMPLRMLETGFSIKLLLGALGAPFGLAVLIFGLRQVIAAGPLYILDETGIESRTGIKWRLAWADIRDISTGRVGPNAWLMFDTLPHVPDPPGRAARLNRRFNMPPYALAPGTSGVDFNALADVVFDLWEAHRGNGAPT
ncbi:hypothetical protein [Hyphomonas sp.]|uniref:hypothetical protein n=1 Tax=Hyphomonas sp. TaxID=87 RepID=UPI003918DF42